MTDSMKNAIGETNRRRAIQAAYNKEHGITPKSIEKKVRDLISITKKVESTGKGTLEKDYESMSSKELEDAARKLQKAMSAAAAELNFELAAELRDKMMEVRKHLYDSKK